MDLHSGYPYWLVKNGLLADFPALEEDLKDEEVLIIGSGISGAFCAYKLCKAGFKCTMIDKRILSSGSTWASTAQLNYEIDSSLSQLADWYGQQYGIDVYTANMKAVDKVGEIAREAGVPEAFNKRPSLYLSSNKSGSRQILEEYEVRSRAGIPVTLLDRKTLRNEYSFDNDYALFHEHAAEMDSYRLTTALIARCNEMGMKVYTRTAITGFDKNKNGFRLKTDRGYTINARNVICATGYESAMFLQKKEMSLHSTYALVTQPIDESLLWKERCLIWETLRPYFYLRTTTDNRIMMGGEDEDFSDDRLRDKLLEKKRDALLKKCRKLFPHINVEADFYWCGTFGETKDGLPLIGQRKKDENIFYALGTGGNGTTYAVMAAEIICNKLRGVADEREELFCFGRKHQR